MDIPDDMGDTDFEDDQEDDLAQSGANGTPVEEKYPDEGTSAGTQKVETLSKTLKDLQQRLKRNERHRAGWYRGDLDQ